jgi:hypothetical protein
VPAVFAIASVSLTLKWTMIPISSQLYAHLKYFENFILRRLIRSLGIRLSHTLSLVESAKREILLMLKCC